MVLNSHEVPEASRSEQLAVGIDIGGTKIAAGVVSPDGAVVEQLAPISTPSGQNDILEALVSLVSELRARHPAVFTIGVGAPGLIDWPDGFIRMAPNTGLDQMPLRGQLESATGLAAIVDNDANVAAWAEARLGQSAPYMLFITVGTGVGGGIILDGQLYRGRYGIAAEIGHILVDPRGGQICGCGLTGCFEAMAAGPALGRYGREAAQAADGDTLLAELAGGAANIVGETVYRAALREDPMALSVYAQLADWLAIGLGSLVTLLDIELIVIGGGVAAAGELLLGPTRAALPRHVVAAKNRILPQIVPATLGNEAGWIGAGLLALDQLGGAGIKANLPSQPATRSMSGSALPL